MIVGDVLLDRDLSGAVERLAPDAPVPVVDAPVASARPGGAGLAAVLAAADGRPVTLITALGEDEAGRELAALLAGAGVYVVDLMSQGPTPEKVRVRAGGRSLLRLDYGGREPAPAGPLTAAAEAALAAAHGIVVSDYGRGLAARDDLRDVLADLVAGVPTVWDPHPRGPEPVAGVRLVTPNSAEAAARTPEIGGDGMAATAARGRALAARWAAGGVAITLGARGALLVSSDGTPLAVPAPPVAHGDPCGAGDRFASWVGGRLADGALPSEAVTEAVGVASRFVGGGGAGSVGGGAPPTQRPRDARDARDAFGLAAEVRSSGGTVVATGGCFDLLHAGHVRMLEAARALGDCLLVCLNSDASIRRLKGPGRPLVPASDRAAVLRGLACVDAVAVFNEDTPAEVLGRLRPHVWAKGADYAVADLPEAAVVARWGGQAVVLPYVAGRSTTRLIERGRAL